MWTMTKLFLLKVLEAYDGGYDSYDGKVIRASNEVEARRMANQHIGDESDIWEDATKVTCIELTPEGDATVILESFNAG